MSAAALLLSVVAAMAGVVRSWGLRGLGGGDLVAESVYAAAARLGGPVAIVAGCLAAALFAARALLGAP